jgi:hypothetical protein
MARGSTIVNTLCATLYRLARTGPVLPHLIARDLVLDGPIKALLDENKR